MPSENEKGNNYTPKNINVQNGSVSDLHEAQAKGEKSIDFRILSSVEQSTSTSNATASAEDLEASYMSSYRSEDRTKDFGTDSEDEEPARHNRKARGRNRGTRDLSDSVAMSQSEVVIIDDYYSQVDPVPSYRPGSIQRKEPLIRSARHRYRRQLTYPAIRSRSLSIGRRRVRTLVPRVTPKLRVSRSRLDLLPPKPARRPPQEEDEESSDEEEEWQYVPFAFCSLPRRDKLILFSLGSVDLTLYMCLSILAPFYPSEAASRGVSGTLSGWVFGVFALTQFFFSPVFGYMLPKVGSRFMVLSGHFFAGGCTVLFGFLDYVPYNDEDNGTLFVTFSFLIRIFLAIGCTASATGSFAIMVKTFPDNVATVFGIMETFCGVGLMVGPALGGVLYEAGGFMLPFVSLGVIMLISVPVNMYILPAQDEDEDSDVETGSIWQVLCIPAVMLVSVATAIGALIWALLDPTLEPHFDVYSLSPSMIGLIFLLMSAFYAASSPFWGWVADRVEDSTPLMVLGFLFSGLGLMLLGPSPLFGFPTGFRAIWLDLLALILLGLSVSLAVVPTFEKILDSAEKAGIDDNMTMYSNIAGLWGGAYALGEFIGPSAGGFIVDQFGFGWCMTFTAAPCVFISLVLFILWIYEKKVGPCQSLLFVAKSTKSRSKPSTPRESSPLLGDQRINEENEEEPRAGPSTTLYGATCNNDLTQSLIVSRQNLDDDFQPMTQSI